MRDKPTMGVIAPDPTPKTERERIAEAVADLKPPHVTTPARLRDDSAAEIARLREEVARLQRERDEALATKGKGTHSE